MVEHFHPELIVNPDLTELRLYVKQALLKLTEVQRRRIVKYIYEEMTIEEIAFEENATKQAVSKSIQAAINNLKNLLSEG